MKLNKIVILVLVFFSVSINAQKVSYPVYKEALHIINPAHVGKTGKKDLTVMIESQAGSLKDNRQFLSFSMPLPKNLSVGVSVLNTAYHINKEIDVYADLSYNVMIDETKKVFFGLKGGGTFISKDFQSLGKSQDIEFAGNPSEFSPNFGVGAYLDAGNYFVSLSIPKVLESKFEKMDKETVVERPNIFVNSGYTFDLNNSSQMKLTPSLLVQYTTVTDKAAIELGANLEFMKQFEVGVAHRFNHSFSALAMFKFMECYKVGFTYKGTTQELNLNSYGAVLKAQF